MPFNANDILAKARSQIVEREAERERKEEEERLAKEAEEKRKAEEERLEIERKEKERLERESPKNITALQNKISSNPWLCPIQDILTLESITHSAEAQALLASRYWDMKDYNNSFLWAQKSADQNNIEGVARLGINYYYGFACEKMPSKGIEMLQKAAQEGSIFAKRTLRQITQN